MRYTVLFIYLNLHNIYPETHKYAKYSLLLFMIKLGDACLSNFVIISLVKIISCYLAPFLSENTRYLIYISIRVLRNKNIVAFLIGVLTSYANNTSVLFGDVQTIQMSLNQ